MIWLSHLVQGLPTDISVLRKSRNFSWLHRQDFQRNAPLAIFILYFYFYFFLDATPGVFVLSQFSAVLVIEFFQVIASTAFYFHIRVPEPLKVGFTPLIPHIQVPEEVLTEPANHDPAHTFPVYLSCLLKPTQSMPRQGFLVPSIGRSLVRALRRVCSVCSGVASGELHQEGGCGQGVH